MPFPCHAVPLKVCNISSQFDLHSAVVSDSHLPCHAILRPCLSSQGHSTAVERRPCCAVALRRTAWSEHGMGTASVNQTRLPCVNQMAKTHSKPLAARHAMCESALRRYQLDRLRESADGICQELLKIFFLLSHHSQFLALNTRENHNSI